MKKIYIIGPVGSGKTTLAKYLSKKLDIKKYELDKVVWDDDGGNKKRTKKEIDNLFRKIIGNKSWIIEDVGRAYFVEGLNKADMVYYLDLNSFTIYKRCIVRWIKQKLGLESYNYKPTIKSLVEMLSWARYDIKNKSSKKEYVKTNSKKYKILSSKDIKVMYGDNYDK